MRRRCSGPNKTQVRNLVIVADQLVRHSQRITLHGDTVLLRLPSAFDSDLSLSSRLPGDYPLLNNWS